jgi:hypothetical protein
VNDFIVKTNFGHTYRWSSHLIATDYADTAIQWQDDPEEKTPKTHEELYQTIVNDEEFLSQWFGDYMQSDVQYAMSSAELINMDEDEYKDFVDWCILNFGATK